MVRSFLLISLILCLVACSTTALGARFTCLQWKTQGLMFSTLDSCQKCVEAHGAANLDQIQGCALGLDASSLIEMSQPQTSNGRLGDSMPDSSADVR